MNAVKLELAETSRSARRLLGSLSSLSGIEAQVNFSDSISIYLTHWASGEAVADAVADVLGNKLRRTRHANVLLDHVKAQLRLPLPVRRFLTVVEVSEEGPEVPADERPYASLAIADGRRFSVSAEDVARLGSGGWLNDTLIMGGLLHLIQQAPASAEIHCFDSSFYDHIARAVTDDDAYQDTHRHARRVDVFTKKVLLVPYCNALHWALIAVFDAANMLQDGGGGGSTTIVAYDSLQHDGHERELAQIKAWLQHEAAAKNKALARSASIVCCSARGPLQPNMDDCGLYLLHFANCIIEKLEDAVDVAVSGRQTAVGLIIDAIAHFCC